MNLERYFQQQMRIIHEDFMGTLMKDHEKVMGVVDGRIQDPHIQRLLEACAYLSGIVHKKFDDELPNLEQSIITRFWPDNLRAIPSMTVVRATFHNPHDGEAVRIPQGTRLQAQEVGPEKTTCHFQTLWPMDVIPLKITNTHLENTNSKQTKLSITFQGHVSHLNKFPLYIQSEFSQALKPFVVDHLSKVTIEYKGEKYKLSLHWVENMNAPLNRPFHDWKSFSLKNYYSMPLLQCFMMLEGFHNIPWLEDSEEFVLVIEGNASLPIALGKNDIQLNCVPAINLFPGRGEPILLSSDRLSYPLVVDYHRKESMVFHHCEKLTLGSLNDTVQKKLKPHGDYEWIREFCENQNIFNYKVLTHPRLSLGALISHLMICNGQYPYKYMAKGALALSPWEGISQICLTNIHEPTSMIHFPTEPIMERLCLSPVETLEQLKEQLEFQLKGIALPLETLLASLQDMQFRHSHKIRQGVHVTLLSIHIILEPSNGLPQVLLWDFMRQLYHFFQKQLWLHQALEFTVDQDQRFVQWSTLEDLNEGGLHEH